MKDFLRKVLAVLRGQDIPNEHDKAYKAELLQLNISAARYITMLSATLVPGSIVLDFFINPNYLKTFFVIRCLMSFSCLFLFGLTYRKKARRYGKEISLLALVIDGAGIALMIRYLGYTNPYYAGLNLIYLASMLVPWSMMYTLAACGIVYGFYLVPILLFDLGGFSLAPFVNNNVFQLETIIIALAVNFFQFRSRRSAILGRLTIAKYAKELKVKDAQKTQFISHVSHELKTPLAILVGNTEILTEELEAQDSSLVTYALQTQQSAYRLANHVDRILKAAKLGEAGEEVNLALYDYIKMVSDTFSLFEGKAKEENIRYQLNVPSLKQLVVQVDTVKLEEILMNLIQNAFKFTDDGGAITVAIHHDGTKVYTEVIDTGKGIPAESIDYVFDRMYQVENILSKSHGGMGLGLYICRKNVELLGGKIKVHSTVGKGTTFRYSLPMYPDQSALVRNAVYDGPDRRQSDRRSGEERRSGSDRRAKERMKRFVYVENLQVEDNRRVFDKNDIVRYENKKPGNPSVLIVEDTPAIVGLIINALEGKYNLFMASNGVEALEKLEIHSDKINLILSDVMMPRMNGFQFCEKVMEHDEYKHIPFVMITALKEREKQVKGYQLGVTDYITKPFNIKILQEKVDNWIERRRQEILLKELSFSLENKVNTVAKLKDIILHELRNPLQVLNGGIYFLQKLKDDLLEQATEQQKKWFKNVDLMADGVEFLKSVLDMSKQLEENALINKQVEPIVSLFDSTLKQTQHLLKDISFELTFSPILRNYRVVCVKSNLTQVFVNLIRNASEAIDAKQSEEKGKITIACSRTDVDRLQIKISDNGIGIPQENIPMVFKHKFTTKNDGNGIGLHFCRKLIQLHEGRIMVESEEGKGTTFIITLPLADSLAPLPQ